MNFPQFRDILVLLFCSYTLALSVVWSNLSSLWNKVRRSNNQKKAIEAAEVKEKPEDSWLLNLQLPKFTDFQRNNKFSFMNARGVHLFSSNGRHDDSDEADVDMGGPMTSDWVGGPRDETTLPRIILATQSSNKEEVEYAFSEMMRILEKIDVEPHLELVQKALAVVIKFCDDKSQSDQQCGIYLNHFPFLFEFTSCRPELKRYKDAMEEYIVLCLESPEPFRRQAVYTAGVLLERNAISQEALRSIFIPKLFELALDINLKDEQRAEIATVLCRIAQCCSLDRQWIFDNYLWRYSKFLDDAVVHVRKAAANIFGDLSAFFGSKFTEAFIVPHLIALSDDMNWGIRKVVSEIFVEVSRHCPPHVRRTILAPRFVRLLQDPSRWVTYQAYQELGPFISTFADSTVTGLHIKNGQVCVHNVDSSLDTPPPLRLMDDFEFNELPRRVWMPESPCSSDAEENDSALDGLKDMLDSWELTNRRSTTHSAPPSISGRKASGALGGGGGLQSAISAAAKCSSYENLADMGLYDAMDKDADHSFMVDPSGMESDEEEEDEEEAMESQEEQPMNTFNYWTPVYVTTDIDDDLIAFGSSQNSPSRQDILTRRFDLLHHSPAARSPTISCTSPTVTSTISCESHSPEVKTTSSISSEADMRMATDSISEESTYVRTPSTDDIITDPMEMDMDLIRDCRGTDDEEMDASTAQSAPSPMETLMSEIVPRELVENYLSMVTASVNQYGSDINRYCAHNFPAVAYTMGRESWPQLKETYSKLSTDDQRVRLCIAMSLHEMARIVGPESTDADLLPIFNTYREESAELRVAILKNLYDFFKCLTPEKRNKMIGVLPEFMPMDNSELNTNWRYRLEFARQCRKLCTLYGVEEINRSMSAIALTLAVDKVGDVRLEAVHLVVEIIRRLVEVEWPQICAGGESEVDDSQQTSLTEQLVADIVNGFAKTQKWTRRQTFANICVELLEKDAMSEEQFRWFLLPHVVAMASDRVPNVRLAVARVLRHLDGEMRPIPLGQETTRSVADFLEKLRGDVDMDVVNEARLAKESVLGPIDVRARGRHIREKEEEFFAKFRFVHGYLDPNTLGSTPDRSSTTTSSSFVSDGEISLSPPRVPDPTANYDAVDMDISPEKKTDDDN